MDKKIRVGLIFGGRSAEHEVSLASAQGVMSALDPEKYEVVPIGITKEGRWLASGDPWKALSSGVAAESQPAALLAEPSDRGLMRLEPGDHGGVQRLTAVHLSQIDVAIPMLHGPFGEDGTVQGLLELAGIAYVGAGVMASALGMDKAVFKDVMRAHGLPIVPYIVVKRRTWDERRNAVLDQVEAEIGYDCFVKPANLGSSVGVSKAHSRTELEAALDEAAQYDRKLVVEHAVDAREIEISVLGNDDPIASVPGEVLPCNEFYDYAAKYVNAESEVVIPAPIPPQTAARVTELAIRAFMAVDCAGMARVDFLLDRQTGEVYLSELNTIPGFTPISLYPKLWEASGIAYPELIDRLIELALERHADKARSSTRYQAEEQADAD